MVALAAVSLSGAGCDSSPWAATVDGQVIKQTALNAELRDRSASPVYMAAAAKSVGASGQSVTGAGTGTYSTSWSSSVLGQMIFGLVLHRHLAATAALPGPGDLDAARALDAALYGPAWYQFSAAYRSTLPGRDGDLARYEPLRSSSASTSPMRSVYQRLTTTEPALFSQVCVRTVFAATLAQADAGAAAIKSARAGADIGGAVSCYSLADFEQQAIGLVDTVNTLPTGRAAAPQKTGGGYQVVAVTSRTLLPFDDATERALGLRVASQTSSAGLSAALAPVLARARVRVNPLYGRWQTTGSAAYSVLAPSGLGTSGSYGPVSSARLPA